MEMRGVNGKNVSTLTKEEVREAKAVLNDYAIKVSSIGSPLGKMKLDGDIAGHIETAKRVFETAIPRNIRLAEAPSHGVPIMLHDVKCSGAKAYLALTEEFLERQPSSVRKINQ